MTEYAGSRKVSKKAYSELEMAYLTEFGKDTAAKILNILKETLKLDPSLSTYTKEQGQKLIEKRKKISKETGISQYVLCGHDKLYKKKKEQLSLKDNSIDSYYAENERK